ncbi:MAG TPA: hypothetical protein VN698_01360 [Bacteroidia bacterium]|nr:hypothetical protein [Bacteroidia bacterium]
MKTNSKYADPEKAICLVCNHVLKLKRPILHVAHDIDNAWKFSCRSIGHKMCNIKVMRLEDVTRLDASLNELLEMPPGVASQRSNVKSDWEPFLLYPDKEEV